MEGEQATVDEDGVGGETLTDYILTSTKGAPGEPFKFVPSGIH